MTIGLVGKKQGMTRIFTPEGEGYAVSVVSVNPNTITQIKSLEVDGYSSVQVTTGEKKEKHIKKPISGHYKKKGINVSKDQSIPMIDAVKDMEMVISNDYLSFGEDRNKVECSMNENQVDCNLIPYELDGALSTDSYYTLVRINNKQIQLKVTGNLSKDAAYFIWEKEK